MIIIKSVYYMLLVMVGVASIYFHFSNPGLTTTQVMIKYHIQYIVGVSLVAAVSIVWAIMDIRR